MNVYVSYRRADSGARAGRLAQSLAQRLGQGAVTWDGNFFDAGSEFRSRLAQALATADAMLVVIGARWLQHNEAIGGPRMHEADDAVRHEIAQALRLGKRVLPVLVDGARMPTEGELPDDIKALAGRNALIVLDTSWEAGVDRVAAVLRAENAASASDAFDRTGELALRDILTGPAPAAARPRSSARAFAPWIAGVGVLLVLAAVWLLLRTRVAEVPDVPPSPSTSDGWGVLVFGLVILLAAIATAVFAWSRWRARCSVAPLRSAGAHVPKVAAAASSDHVDVFVSHASEDQALAQDIVGRLEPRLRCWIAPRDIPPGVPSWAGPIVEAIARCRVFVVIVSGHSVQSKEVLREVTIANDENVAVMPVRIDDAPLSSHLRYFFATVQRLEAMGWPRDRLLAGISDGVGRLIKGSVG